MDKSLQLIGRFTVIVFGYGCAVLAAGLFINILLVATISTLPGLIDSDLTYGVSLGYTSGLLVATPFLAMIIGYFAFWPSVVIIAAGEYFRKRDSLYYTLCGLLTGLLLFFSAFQNDKKAAGEMMMLMSIAAAGIIGGFTYWLVAGRRTNTPSSKETPDNQ